MKQALDKSTMWLLIAIGMLVIYLQTKKAATTTQTVTKPNTIPSGGLSGSLNAIAAPTETTPTPTPTPTPIGDGITYLTDLPSWIPAWGYSYSEAAKDLSVWLYGTGLYQVKIVRDGAVIAGDGWTEDAWGNAETATSLGYDIAPYSHVKRYNHSDAVAGSGVTPGETQIFIRKTAAPTLVYKKTLSLSGEKARTVVLGTLPTVTPTPTPTPTPEPVSDTIESWAMTSRTYGTPTLKYVNDTSFFAPRIVDNGDDTISVVDDANYVAGPGKLICYELNYYGAERDIKTLVGRKFKKPYSVLITKYEANQDGWEGQTLIDARQEINQVIYKK